MAIFTAIATFILAGTFLAGTIAVPLLAAAIGIGASYAIRALSGAGNVPDAARVDNFSVQGKLQAGGDVPRSFQLGYSVTSGSLVYANSWGANGETPNAFFTQVIALQDVPGGAIDEIWINGEKCTIAPDSTFGGSFAPADGSLLAAVFGAQGTGIRGGTADPGYKGMPVLQYRKYGVDHLWIKFYDGNQTVADPLLVGSVSSSLRPYDSTRVGRGIAYVVVTSLVDDTLFTGFPSFKFAMSGIPLYDISKDTSAGGDGPQRWADRSTWGGDGDKLPAVQIYNLLRGIRYNGQWLYGLQTLTGARLPAANWIAQIAKCRAQIAGENGLEPTYRAGGQINVDAQLANAVEALLTSCQGRLSEIGGFYKIHLGAPDSPTFSFTDADILSTEEQIYKPFFALADSVNGIAANYPYPAEGWNTKAAPALYRTDLEALDGGRRLMANPSFDFVPYSAQVQRLMSSALQEAQRARTHVLTLPPGYWPVEPGDIGLWTSARNGYVNKLMRADGVVDRANLDVGLNLTEVDPSDYDPPALKPITKGPNAPQRPSPQAIRAFDAAGDILKDADGLSRRPAIRLSWDGTLPGIAGVQWEVRLAADLSPVTRDNDTVHFSLGTILITQSLLPSTVYQVRAAYIPTAARDMLWSDWLTVATPDVRLSLSDQEASIRYQVTTIARSLQDQLDYALQQISDLAQNNAMQGVQDKKDVRSQLASRSDAAFASIDDVRTVATGTQGALASLTTSVNAQFGQVNAQIQVNATAIATLNSSFSDYKVTTTASIGSLSSSVTINATAIARLDGYAASKFGVRLDVNGYATGFDLINAGEGVSAFNIVADRFQIAQPGVNGGAAVPVFTVATINGVAKLGLRGDMIVDGTINAQKIAIGGVDVQNIVLNAATRRTVKAYTGPSALNLGSQTEPILSGTATCVLSGGFSALDTNNNPVSASLQLFVDGTALMGWGFSGNISGSWMWDVTGLSSGNHTFFWRVVSGGLITVGSGQTTVIDLRR